MQGLDSGSCLGDPKAQNLLIVLPKASPALGQGRIFHCLTPDMTSIPWILLVTLPCSTDTANYFLSMSVSMLLLIPSPNI